MFQQLKWTHLNIWPWRVYCKGCPGTMTGPFGSSPVSSVWSLRSRPMLHGFVCHLLLLSISISIFSVNDYFIIASLKSIVVENRPSVYMKCGCFRFPLLQTHIHSADHWDWISCVATSLCWGNSDLWAPCSPWRRPKYRLLCLNFGDHKSRFTIKRN